MQTTKKKIKYTIEYIVEAGECLDNDIIEQLQSYGEAAVVDIEIIDPEEESKTTKKK